MILSEINNNRTAWCGIRIGDIVKTHSRLAKVLFLCQNCKIRIKFLDDGKLIEIPAGDCTFIHKIDTKYLIIDRKDGMTVKSDNDFNFDSYFNKHGYLFGIIGKEIIKIIHVGKEYSKVDKIKSNIIKVSV